MAVGVYCFTTSAGGFDVYRIMATFCFLMAFVCFASPFWLHERPAKESVYDTVETEEKSFDDEYREWEKKSGLKSYRRRDD